MRVKKFGFVVAMLLLLFGTLTSQLLALQTGNQEPIYSLDWKPNDSLIAVGRGGMGCSTFENNIFVVDSLTQQTVATFSSHTCEVNSVSWNSDGTKLASASQDGTIRIWEAATGQILLTSSPQVAGRVEALWSPDDTQIATFIDGDGGVEILDSTKLQRQGYFCCVDGPVREVDWSGNGSRIAIGGDSGEIWDVATQQNLVSLQDNPSPISALTWREGGDKIATGHKDNKIRIWNAKTGAIEFVLQGHTDSITGLKWNQSGTMLASSSLDGTVRTWDIITKVQTAIFSSPSGEDIFSLTWSPDDTKLAYGSASGALQIVSTSDTLPISNPTLKLVSLITYSIVLVLTAAIALS